MALSKAELLTYMRGRKLAVLASLGAEGQPQAALIGVATADDFVVVFDTVSTSRKHANLTRNPKAALTFSGPGEQTLQCEGLAAPLVIGADQDQAYLEVYYQAWPDGRARLSWPNLAYWRFTPVWARFADFEREAPFTEFRWDRAG